MGFQLFRELRRRGWRPSGSRRGRFCEMNHEAAREVPGYAQGQRLEVPMSQLEAPLVNDLSTTQMS